MITNKTISVLEDNSQYTRREQELLLKIISTATAQKLIGQLDQAYQSNDYETKISPTVTEVQVLIYKLHTNLRQSNLPY